MADTVRTAIFTDPVSDRACTLVIPAGGMIFPRPGDAKIGVGHPGCQELADLSLDLDAFCCPACRWNGRVSGAWAMDQIEGTGDGETVDAVIHAAGCAAPGCEGECDA